MTALFRATLGPTSAEYARPRMQAALPRWLGPSSRARLAFCRLSSESLSVAETEFIIPKSTGGLTRSKHDALCFRAAFAANAPPGSADVGRGSIVGDDENKPTSTAERPAEPSQMQGREKRNRGPGP